MIIRLLAVDSALAALAVVLSRAFFPRWIPGAAKRWRTVTAALALEWASWSPAQRVLANVVVVFAFAIRAYHMSQPIRYDEAYTYLYFAGQPLSVALSDYSLPNNHLFHTFLVWMSVRVFGHAEWAIRVPVLVAGTMVVPASYWAARVVGDAWSGLVAASLAAAIPVLILFSTNARGYIIICLAFLVLVIIARSIIEQDAPELWVFLAIVVSVGTYTAPVMIYPAGVVSVWMCSERYRRGGRPSLRALLPRLQAALAIAGVLSLMAYAPVFLHSGVSSVASNRFVTPQTLTEFTASLPVFVGNLSATLALGLPFPLTIIVALGAVFALVAPPEQRSVRRSLALAVALWSIALMVASRRAPPARVWLFVSVAGCLFAGCGLASFAQVIATRLRVRSDVLIATMVFALIVGIGLLTVDRRTVFLSEETDLYGLREAPQVARYLLSELKDGDRLVVVQFGPSLDFYLTTLGGHRLSEFTPKARTDRVLVVVNARHGQTLAGVRRARGDVPWDRLLDPVLVHLTGAASVYAYRSVDAMLSTP